MQFSFSSALGLSMGCAFFALSCTGTEPLDPGAIDPASDGGGVVSSLSPEQLGRSDPDPTPSLDSDSGAAPGEAPPVETPTDRDAGASSEGSDEATESADAGSPDENSQAGAGPAEPKRPTEIVPVRLVPRNGGAHSGVVNFAVPLPPRTLEDPADLRALHDGTEIDAPRRALARYRDGSIRSVQLQMRLDISQETTIDIEIGRAPETAAAEQLVPVESTLHSSSGTDGPTVWAVLPSDWLSASLVAGPLLAEDDVADPSRDGWRDLCDYDLYDADAFFADSGTASLSLYDRGTVMYRGYARRGDLATLSSAYRETAHYRATLSGSGPDTRIGVPGKENDLKYHYAQSLAIHYLLTGDDRFRESAEDLAERVADLWRSPGYAGGADFWTERHAGFALLTYVWAMLVSDDQIAELRALANDAVDTYLQVQESWPTGYLDTEARCFAHHADAHAESYGYFGCSPWMSAILADALDTYARESSPARAKNVRDAIVRLGRAIARDGLDPSGKPYYWMGVGSDRGEVDPYDEHWGESAYVLAMASYYADDAALASVADGLVDGLIAHGSAPHMRSFNWQCRSAVATPWYLAR